MLKKTFHGYMNANIVLLILAGVILGGLFGWLFPNYAESVGFLGKFFVSALKGAAPILVFILVMSTIAQHKQNTKVYVGPVVVLYIFGTFFASVVGVGASFLFPTELILEHAQENIAPPANIAELLGVLLLNMVDNPINALAKANYIGILTWAVLVGLGLRHANNLTKDVFSHSADAITLVVRWIIRIAPFGVFGLVASTVATNGAKVFTIYGHLVLVLVGSMAFVALVINPLMVFWKLRKNPYPLCFRCYSESGVTAFFTRSSAANIPVNMNLCQKLGLNKDSYSVTITLGATINMAGAAITIAVLSLAAVHTLNIPITFGTALVLSVVATVAACGASGVPSGSLLLIPMACSLFNISNDIAAQVIAVGVAISVIQDSTETALNSSTDVLFTAAAELGARRKLGKS